MAKLQAGRNLRGTPALSAGTLQGPVAPMSGIAQNQHVPLTGRDIELTDTDVPVADHRDELGRPIRHTLGQAFVQDLPWIIALIALIAFDIAALAGYFR